MKRGTNMKNNFSTISLNSMNGKEGKQTEYNHYDYRNTFTLPTTV